MAHAPTLRKPLLVLGTSLVLLLAGYFGGTGAYTAHALLHPTRFDYPDTPERYGLHPESVTLTVPGPDRALPGWLFELPSAHGRAVVFLHGWRSHRRHMLHGYLSWLAKRYTVLAFDHLNHGDAPGGLTTLGARERLDAGAAIALLRTRGYSRIAVFGASMGGNTALNAAAADPAIRAAVTDATFARPEGLVESYFALHHYLAPGPLAWSTMRVASLEIGQELEGTSGLRAIARLAPRPVFLIHGTLDHVIAPSEGEALAAAATGPHALWRVAGADHLSEAGHGPHDVAPVEYERRVTAFLDRVLAE